MPINRKSSGVAQPTIREVSRQAGVSTATVSRVLSGLGGASAETQRRIQDVVRELGYRPNRAASGLRTARSKVVGVVIPDLQNPFFTGVVAGIEEVLRDAGYTLFLANSDEDPSLERFELESFQAERASGVLVIPCEAKSTYGVDLRQAGMPVVMIDRVSGDLEVDSVTSANESGAFRAVERLLKFGYKTVGMVNGPDTAIVAEQRALGYFRAMERGGCSVNEKWVSVGDFRIEGGYQSTLEVLGHEERPRALFIGNFLMALGALRAIRELGLRVPEDVALISFDDMPWAEAVDPPLSTVAQPAREIGRSAARLLLDRLEGEERPVCRIVLDTELIVRESCGTRGMEALK